VDPALYKNTAALFLHSTSTPQPPTLNDHLLKTSQNGRWCPSRSSPGALRSPGSPIRFGIREEREETRPQDRSPSHAHALRHDSFEVLPSFLSFPSLPHSLRFSVHALTHRSYLDRNALANARIQGIEASIGLVGSQFNTAISVLFAGYIFLQIPSNMVITRVRPSIYLPACMALWGVVSGLTAVTHDFTSLVLVRFFLGFVEA
jgi:hypothetical protein